jgi:hypothetical protein
MKIIGPIEDPIVDLIRKRILELLPAGLIFLWFPFKTDGMRELATVFGYTYENFKDMFSVVRGEVVAKLTPSNGSRFSSVLRPNTRRTLRTDHVNIRFDSIVMSIQHLNAPVGPPKVAQVIVV